MSRKKTAYLVLAALMTVVFGFVWMISPQWTRTHDGTVTIEGNMPGALNEARLVGHKTSAKQMDIVLGLKLRNEAELDDMINRQSDPTSPDFRKFITPDEFVGRFAPTQNDVDKLIDFLQQQKLEVVEVAPNRLLIHVRGTVTQIEKAFSVKINTYSVGPKEAFSNDRNPSVPAEFKDVVQSVIGLNSFAEYHKRLVRRAPSAPVAPTMPSGFSPKDLSTAYNFPNVLNARTGVTYTGAGVTIAIASVYSYQDSDVQKYWQTFGVNRTGSVRNVYVNGRSKQLDDETTLDLQQSSSLAPGADVVMYLGKDPSFGSFAKVFNRIVVENKAAVASISWGLCEQDTGSAEMSTEHTIFRQGTAQGITWFAAAGDDGAYDCKRKKVIYSTDYPSSDPYVTAVGGTALRINADGSRNSERAWVGAGGANSSVYRRPAWQFGPGVPSGDMRATSDLSLNADPWTGDAIFFEGKWDSSGGTSFAAPDTAALWALLVQANGGRLGYAMPTLYRIGRSADYPKVFFDVINGANGNMQGAGYAAGPGWDHPTGWGSPDGRALMQWILNDQSGSSNPAGTPLSDYQPLTEGPPKLYTSPPKPASLEQP